MKQFNEKGYALFKEVGNIDDPAVSDAMYCPTRNKVKSGFWGWIAIAACLAVMTGVLMFVKPAKNITPGSTETGESEALTGEPGTSAFEGIQEITVTVLNTTPSENPLIDGWVKRSRPADIRGTVFEWLETLDPKELTPVGYALDENPEGRKDGAVTVYMFGRQKGEYVQCKIMVGTDDGLLRVSDEDADDFYARFADDILFAIEDQGSPETEPPIAENPLARYGEGIKLVIAVPSDADMTLFDAEEKGHLVSRALYMSRNGLAEKTGLEIKTAAISDATGFYNAVRKACHAGETDCDVYEITAQDMVLLASEGALMPFGLSYDGQPGCDLTQPYWNQAVQRDLSPGGYTYVMSSAADLSVNASTACVAFNESMAEELGLDLYAEAKNGNWDTEILLTLMKQGNLLSGDPHAAEYLYFGMGGRLCDPDGAAYPTPCFDSPDFDGFFNKVLLLTENDSFRSTNFSGMPLFTVTTLGKGTWIKGLGGVLPMPAAEKSEYRSPVDLNTARFCGVTHRDEFDAAFAFDALALAASEAYGKLSEDYIDAITIASDDKENAKAMVGIILANQRMDPCLAGTDLYFDDVLRNSAAAFTEVQAAWDMESTKTEEAKRLSDWAASK